VDAATYPVNRIMRGIFTKADEVYDEALLSPRLIQVLRCLLRGLAEKEIAYELKISQHTVHVYIKQLHRMYKVESRGELLALWINQRSAAERTIVGVLQAQSARCLAQLFSKREELTRAMARLDAQIAEKLKSLTAASNGNGQKSNKRAGHP
jgi:DNA-binding CsgD family transcriptional regulator